MISSVQLISSILGFGNSFSKVCTEVLIFQLKVLLCEESSKLVNNLMNIYVKDVRKVVFINSYMLRPS